MARYPIKMLKDESGTPFVPLVAPEAVKDGQGFNLQTVLGNKLEKTNIIAGDNITLSVSGNNITINSQAGGAATNVIDNLNQQTAGVGVLDAHQGYVLKGMIPGVQNTLTSTSTTDALSAYQGYLLSNRVVPSGGTANQVLAKNSATDNDLKWVSLASVATSGSYSDLSGKPTIPEDYIIESGTSGDWTYVKYSTGRKEAWGNITKSVTVNKVEGALYYGDFSTTWFPSIFNSTPVMTTTCTRSGGYGCYYVSGTTTASGSTGWVYCNIKTDSAASITVSFHLIGT